MTQQTLKQLARFGYQVAGNTRKGVGISMLVSAVMTWIVFFAMNLLWSFDEFSHTDSFSPFPYGEESSLVKASAGTVALDPDSWSEVTAWGSEDSIFPFIVLPDRHIDYDNVVQFEEAAAVRAEFAAIVQGAAADSTRQAVVGDLHAVARTQILLKAVEIVEPESEKLRAWTDRLDEVEAPLTQSDGEEVRSIMSEVKESSPHLADELTPWNERVPEEHFESFRAAVYGLPAFDVDSDTLSIVWFARPKDDESDQDRHHFVLEVSSSDVAGRWGVRTRSYIAAPASSIGAESARWMPFVSSESPYQDVCTRSPWYWGFRPVAVLVTEEQIADGFFLDYQRIQGRLDETQLASLDKDEVVRHRAFLEEVLRHRLGRPVDASAAVSTGFLRDYEGMESWTRWVRRVNGSNAMGIIQVLIVFGFLMGALSFLAHIPILILWKKDREQLAGEQEKDAPDDTEFAALESQWLKTTRLPRWVHGTLQQKLDRGDVPSERQRSFIRELTEEGYENFDNSLGLLGYLGTVLPSIGFIGTVLGIGAALGRSGAVVSSDAVVRQRAVQGMSMDLGVAFDTTFLSLVLGIVVGLMYYSLAKIGRSQAAVMQEQLIQITVQKRKGGK